MKTAIRLVLSVFAISFAVGFAGCGDDTSSGAGVDMTATAHDLATATVHDLATGTVGDGGLEPLAAACTADAECASNFCGTYKMGAEMLCTEHCTSGQAAPQCTSPGNGMCNGMNECMFPGM
ncbi:MAG TPA: hypothetical protein VGL86_25915 [Polyangia bacterium]|jgi:predicted small secreted protein